MKQPKFEEEIKEEVSYLSEKYFTFDLPVPFNGLELYPVSVKNHNEFFVCSTCLQLYKNDDPAGLRMTQLEYLLYKMKDEKEGPVWSQRFSRLLELCFHIKNGMKCPVCHKVYDFAEILNRKAATEEEMLQCECGNVLEPVIRYEMDEQTKKIALIVDGHKIDHKQFMKLRKYIMYQNLPDFKDDEWVAKELRDDHKLEVELTSKNKGQATLERKIIGICAQVGYTIKEVCDMSLRKFLEILGMIDDIIEYNTTKQGLMSGMVSLKKGATIEHWLYKKEEGMYGKAIDADTYISQIQNN